MRFIKLETSAKEEGYVYLFMSHGYKIWNDVSINSETIESVSINISSKKAGNLIFNMIYTAPTWDLKVFEQFCKDICSKNKNIKHMIFAGDFNMNVRKKY